MKSGRAFAVLAGFWFCLNPFIDGDDGTLPLPHKTVQGSDQQADDDSIWDLLCR